MTVRTSAPLCRTCRWTIAIMPSDHNGDGGDAKGNGVRTRMLGFFVGLFQGGGGLLFEESTWSMLTPESLRCHNCMSIIGNCNLGLVLFMLHYNVIPVIHSGY
ncbi:hypothetical protein BS17DRAFT_54740 [Gyrodon lividus]|nr:hypothetical protein BS17DRAFT_54740 [Gyrodon lividus]